ncbi:hypothetical protein [Kitasatospora sp. NPDC056531]|uniref:hypothetical protein n=1 Tax=Kitasatospora sp. NPDC056531 TaxID=3345856 RepID=UPI0036BAB83A
MTAEGNSTPSPIAAPATSSQTPSGPKEETYTIPPTWTEPVRWAVLPRGSRTAATTGYQTGFPDTTEGAVAVLVAGTATNMQSGTSHADQQAAIYHTYLSSTDQSPDGEAKVRAKAQQTEAENRSELGLPTDGPLPSGAFVRSNVVGFKVIQQSPSEVTVYLLTKVSRKAGDTSPVKDAYVISVLGAAWQNTDWKMSVKATTDAVARTRGQQSPALAAPGDAKFNDAGWTALRQAA